MQRMSLKKNRMESCEACNLIMILEKEKLIFGGKTAIRILVYKMLLLKKNWLLQKTNPII